MQRILQFFCDDASHHHKKIGGGDSRASPCTRNKKVHLLNQKRVTMKKVFYPIAAALIVLASAFTIIAAQDYKISDGYAVKFEAAGASGIFKTLKGDISFDEKNLAASKFNVTIDVASINTGNGLKNTH